jgi:hypothetical protein
MALHLLKQTPIFLTETDHLQQPLSIQISDSSTPLAPALIHLTEQNYRRCRSPRIILAGLTLIGP